MTASGIEPAAFCLVERCLDQSRHLLSRSLKVAMNNSSFIHSFVFSLEAGLAGNRVQSCDRYGSDILHPGQVLGGSLPWNIIIDQVKLETSAQPKNTEIFFRPSMYFYDSRFLVSLGLLVEYILETGRVAQSVQRLTMGWTVRDRIPVGRRFSARPDRPWGRPGLV